MKSAKVGYQPDGDGLYLQCSSASAKSWVYRYKIHGRARDMGLGSYPDMSLAEVREEAKKWRQVRARGEGPIEVRRAQRQAEADKRVAAAGVPTFKIAAERYIDMRKSVWRSVKHKVQWVSSLERYAFPIVGNVSVADINFGHVMSVLEQKVHGGGAFWNGKTETANRVRGHTEAILGWAQVQGMRKGENVARWRFPRQERSAEAPRCAANATFCGDAL